MIQKQREKTMAKSLCKPEKYAIDKRMKLLEQQQHLQTSERERERKKDGQHRHANSIYIIKDLRHSQPILTIFLFNINEPKHFIPMLFSWLCV